MAGAGIAARTQALARMGDAASAHTSIVSGIHHLVGIAEHVVGDHAARPGADDFLCQRYRRLQDTAGVAQAFQSALSLMTILSVLPT
ncbi:hypothetical protein SALBM135S_05599 [Streptomyces alboniger]